MECVRLINWCLERSRTGLDEKWLVRFEDDGRYQEFFSEVHRPLLNKCETVDAAIKTVFRSHDRPIPYHPIDITINESDGRIHSYVPRHNDWENLADIPNLVNIADEINLVSVIIKKQQQPTGDLMNKARLSVLKEKGFFVKATPKKLHDITELLTALTNVKPLNTVVKEQHRGVLSTQNLSARETLFFLKDHASRTGRAKETLTVYRLHMNRAFAKTALKIIYTELLTEKQRHESPPVLPQSGYCVSIPNSFIRFVFFTDETQVNAHPLERLFFEQYYTVPCETGPFNASCAENVSRIFSRMSPPRDTNPTTAHAGVRGEKASSVALVDTRRGTDSEGKIAVFDYAMFYPYVLCVSMGSPSYERRVLHMAATRRLLTGVKSMYTKEIGVLKLVRGSLYDSMFDLSVIILNTLVHMCKQTGLQVVLNQTDSVTVRVPPSVMQATGGSLQQLASDLQRMVRTQHPTFGSELKLEREGTSMIVFNANKHILYDGQQRVHSTGFESKTFCPAMARTINETTLNKDQSLQLLCLPDSPSGGGQSTSLSSFVSQKLREHTAVKADLACRSYGLPFALLPFVVHVQPGEDGLFTAMPTLYRTCPQYCKDNALTMPTFDSFMSSLKIMAGTTIKHLDNEQTKRVLKSIFAENMGMVRWRLVKEQLLDQFVMDTVRFLTGGQLA
jgi:hypothetical protein